MLIFGGVSVSSNSRFDDVWTLSLSDGRWKRTRPRWLSRAANLPCHHLRSCAGSDDCSRGYGMAPTPELWALEWTRRPDATLLLAEQTKRSIGLTWQITDGDVAAPMIYRRQGLSSWEAVEGLTPASGGILGTRTSCRSPKDSIRMVWRFLRRTKAQSLERFPFGLRAKARPRCWRLFVRPTSNRVVSSCRGTSRQAARASYNAAPRRAEQWMEVGRTVVESNGTVTWEDRLVAPASGTVIGSHGMTLKQERCGFMSPRLHPSRSDPIEPNPARGLIASWFSLREAAPSLSYESQTWLDACGSTTMCRVVAPGRLAHPGEGQ